MLTSYLTVISLTCLTVYWASVWEVMNKGGRCPVSATVPSSVSFTSIAIIPKSTVTSGWDVSSCTPHLLSPFCCSFLLHSAPDAKLPSQVCVAQCDDFSSRAGKASYMRSQRKLSWCCGQDVDFHQSCIFKWSLVKGTAAHCYNPSSVMWPEFVIFSVTFM